MKNAIFVFEDAHWIDSQSWVMLQMVLPKLASQSMVMIVTRPPNMASQERGGGTEGFDASEEKMAEEFLEDDDRIKFTRILSALKEQEDIKLLSLSGMSKDAMKELIAKTLDVPLNNITDEFVDTIDQKAGGVPMYLTSITAWLSEKGMVTKDENDNISFKGDIKDIKFPNSIVDTVIGRIDSLGETENFIKSMLLLRLEFAQDNLKMSHHNSLILRRKYLKMLRTLAARQLVVPIKGESTRKMLKFTHQIICESAYNNARLTAT